MQFSTFIPLALLALSNLVLANTADFDHLARFKAGMQAGHAYAFKAGPHLGHQRLIVARITGTPGNLDAHAEMFQVYCDPDTGKKYSKNCASGWTCTATEKYRYKAEIDGDLTFIDIAIRGQFVWYALIS